MSVLDCHSYSQASKKESLEQKARNDAKYYDESTLGKRKWDEFELDDGEM